jgi:hypothetical protein
VRISAPVNVSALVGAFGFTRTIIRYPFTYSQELFALTSYTVYVYDLTVATRLPKNVRAYFSKLGKKGGKKGGAARASNLTAEQRSESARNAVVARWKKVKENASHAD